MLNWCLRYELRGALRLGSPCSSLVKRALTETFQSPDKASPMITETEGKTTYQHCERIT